MVIKVSQSLIKKHYTGDEFESASVLNPGVDIENICPKPDKNVKSLRPKAQIPYHGRKRRYK